MSNIFDILGNKLFPKPQQIPVDSVKKADTSEKEFKMLKAYGITSDSINRFLAENLILNSDRTTIYRQLESSLTHPLISSAIDLYAETSCNRSVVNNKIVWVESDNKEYKYQIEKLLDVINVEEVIYDWAWTTGFYGDLFVKVNGEPGLGVVSIEDDLHPISMSRCDYQGRLIGFFETPQGTLQVDRELQAPYQYVHFRLLGSKKRRPIYGDANYTEFRSISLMAPDIRRINSKYGVSLANNALPIYRRLRLTEDSILMSRITKGVTRYLYSVGVGENSTPEAIASLIDNYVDVLKSARCVVGSTEINLLDGTNPTIKEMADNSDKYIGKYVYSINQETKSIEPDKIIAVQKTRLNAELVRIHLDNGKHVDCTPDHRFMLRDGSYKEAQYLVEGESLMPLYTKFNKSQMKKYKLVYNPKTDSWHYIHRLVMKSINPDINFKGKHIHHRNMCQIDNDPNNLELLSKEEHFKLHHLLPKWNQGKTKETDEKVLKMSYNLSNTLRLLHSIGKLVVWNKGLTKELDERVNKYVKTHLGKKRSEESKSKQSLSIKGKPRPLSRKNRVQRICLFCSKEFEVIETSKKKYCCYECGRHSRKGKKNTDRHNACISLKNKHKIFSDEHRYTLSLSHIGKIQTEETKIKRSNSLKLAYKEGRRIPNKVWNHKVIKVEILLFKEDTYDLTTEKNHNFAINNSIFVHNSMDLNVDNPSYSSKSSPLSALEDIILPVWGDVNNLKIDKIGGDFEQVKWIADLDEQRNQLMCALKVPASLLGGYQSETQGPLGGTAAERIDIRFSRQCRRLQTALKSGLTRLAQIHLAYQGLNPDLNMFEIKMAEISTAEELEAQKALGEAADTVDRVTELIFKHTGQTIDKVGLLNYFNKKLMKLEDLDLKKMMKAAKDLGPRTSIPSGEITNTEPQTENPFRESKEDEEIEEVRLYENADLKAELPKDLIVEEDHVRRGNKLWESKYSGIKVNIEVKKDGTGN